MANEVEIRITSRNMSGSGFAAVRSDAKKTEASVRSFGSVAVSASGKIRSSFGLAKAGIAGFVGGAVVSGVVGLGSKVLDLGVKVEAMGNKAKVVFGGSLPVVQRWADVASVKMGLTSKEAQGLAAGIGDLLTPLGFAQKQAATMSTKVADLAGAFSQWSNGTKSTADATDALTGALTGEFDSLKEYG
ncbi:MAG TPA: hypothetical protein VIV12_06650, partial [Streptosporangiaceae bacterium]